MSELIAGVLGAAEASPVLFSVLGLEVTSRVTTMWAIMAVLVLVSFLATRNMQRIPHGVQNLMEWAVESLLNFFAGIMGYEKARRFLPLLVTLFIFILLSNYSGLIPGAGEIPGLAAPTSTWSVTAGLAIVVFFATHVSGFMAHGWRYLKHFTQPLFFMLPLKIIEEFVRPLSLSLRLYGNIFGEEMVIVSLLGIIPYFVPIAMMGLSLLMGFIQALVFTLLSSVYLTEATEAE